MAGTYTCSRNGNGKPERRWSQGKAKKGQAMLMYEKCNPIPKQAEVCTAPLYVSVSVCVWVCGC